MSSHFTVNSMSLNEDLVKEIEESVVFLCNVKGSVKVVLQLHNLILLGDRPNSMITRILLAVEANNNLASNFLLFSFHGKHLINLVNFHFFS